MSPIYTKARKKARSPLGAFISRFLSGKHDVRALAVELFGEERAAQWLQRLSRFRFRSNKGAAQAVELHEDNAAHVGRFFAWLCMVLEHVDPKYRKACSRKLFQGRSRVWSRELGRPVYLPKEKVRFGTAARLGVSVREVQRYAMAADRLGILSRTQVKDTASVRGLPKAMRGTRWSYSILHWAGEIPRAVQGHLSDWWGKRSSSEPGAAHAATPRGQGAAVLPASVAENLSAVLASYGPPEPSGT